MGVTPFEQALIDLRAHACNTTDWGCRVNCQAAFSMSSEQRIAVIPQDGCFIVLGWYKSRQRTELALWVDGGDIRPVTLEQANTALAGF